MTESYRRLPHDDESQIYVHKSNGVSNDRVAKRLGVDGKTLERETKRNSGEYRYRFRQVSDKLIEGRKAGSSMTAKLVSLLLEEVWQIPHKEWNSEWIGGTLRLENLFQLIALGSTATLDWRGIPAKTSSITSASRG